MMAFSISHYKAGMELRERLDYQVKLVAEQKAQLKSSSGAGCTPPGT